MQQSAREPFPYVAGEIPSQPRRHVRALRRIDHALDHLDRLAMRCLKAIGRAYLDGVIAYGAGMHGLACPIDEETQAAPPAAAPVLVDPYGDMAEAQSWRMNNGSGKSLFQYEPGQTGGEGAHRRPLVVGRKADETWSNPWSLSSAAAGE